jgi:hypothetical protein
MERFSGGHRRGRAGAERFSESHRREGRTDIERFSGSHHREPTERFSGRHRRGGAGAEVFRITPQRTGRREVLRITPQRGNGELFRRPPQRQRNNRTSQDWVPYSPPRFCGGLPGPGGLALRAVPPLRWASGSCPQSRSASRTAIELRIGASFLLLLLLLLLLPEGLGE